MLFLSVLLQSLLAKTTERLIKGNQICSNYLMRAETGDPSQEIPTIFTGDIAFDQNTLSLWVHISFTDSWFNSVGYFGLNSTDINAAEEACLNLILFKFSSDSYIDPYLIIDLPFTFTVNDHNKLRNLSLQFSEAELSKRLVQTSNSHHNIYIGYYSISFELNGTQEIIQTYFFEFAIAFDKISKSIIQKTFRPLNMLEMSNCQLFFICQLQLLTKLNFCVDSSCVENYIPQLVYNDEFYLQQIVSQKELQKYYLTNTTVYYIGNGLFKQATPLRIDNSVKGQVIILLSAEVAWSELKIGVTSYISHDQQGVSLFEPVNGVSDIITCIKFTQASTTCPDCQEEFQANGFAREGCKISQPEQISQEMKLFIFGLIYLLI